MTTKGKDEDYEALCDEVFTPEARFHAWANGRDNVFLTGMGGTGKSHLLREWIDMKTRFLDQEAPIITAPTGIAALNIGGMTVHRWSGMMLGPKNRDDMPSFLQNHLRRLGKKQVVDITEAKTLVIDEISMLPGLHLDYLNAFLKSIRGNREPFGGLQIIAIGDFLQLPPVRLDDGAPYDWAFESNAWQEAEFKAIALKTIRRQEEKDYSEALACIRLGDSRSRKVDVIKGRVMGNPPMGVTRVFTHNDAVDKWNGFALGEIDGEERVITAMKIGTPSYTANIIKNMQPPENLKLKLGALVMCTRNDAKAGIVNGQLGEVVGIPDRITMPHTDAPVIIRLKGGGYASIYPFLHSFTRGEEDGGGQVLQYPLRLAYAMTIHKCQGLTLDSAYMDIRAAREPGQAYVALSRVRRLDGLMIKEWPNGFFVSNTAKRFYSDHGLL